MSRQRRQHNASPRRRTRDGDPFVLICVVLFMAIATCAAPVGSASSHPLHASDNIAARARYQITLTLDFDARNYTGTERVRWVNRNNHSTSVIYFHLYSNLRSNLNNGGAQVVGADATNDADEPLLEITQVRDAKTQTPLNYSFDDQETTLRVNLHGTIVTGNSTEIEIAFKGSVPEIDPDETSLPAHVVQQLGAALRDTRETRRARDLNFRSRGVMLLGTAYPMLAVRDGDNWQREVKASVGDWVYTEVADYDVRIEAPASVVLFTSGEEQRLARNDSGGKGEANIGGDHGNMSAREFAGENLRNFAIVGGRSLASAEREVSGVRVRSIWTPEHEKIGRRVLNAAAEATRVFVARFGSLPAATISVTEAPLVAGVGSAEFTNLSVVASAFYVDFDAPSMRNLPEVVREQRASVEDSLEFATAQMIAHQWWGITVGNAPDRTPILDEALAHWSALLYYQEARGTERATQARDDQLRGVYEIYRTFGGEDMAADRPARDYRNSFQYAAIVDGKGALMFSALQTLLGDARFFNALRHYYEANRLQIAELDDLRGAFVAEAPIEKRREVTRTFDRWLAEKHGDEDVAPPNPQLAATVGINTEPSGARDRNAFSRLGRFFWRQMTRIR